MATTPTPTFCICIPCAKQHIPYVETCLQYIEAQTIQPQFVVLVVSETQTVLQLTHTYRFPIKQIISTAPQCAGTNRNIGAMYAKDKVDHIYFFDADDIMHPQYCETVSQFFAQYPDQTFVGVNFHLVKYHEIENYLTHLPFDPIPSPPMYHPNYIETTDPSWPSVQPLQKESMAKGPISIRSSIFNHTLYKKDYGVGEDGEFLYRLVHQGQKGGYIPHKLFYYIRYIP